MFKKEAEEYRKNLKSKFFLSEPQLDLACQGFKDGYNKANEWHDINDTPPSKEQLGKQLLIRLESVTGGTDYDYLVYKYAGESITDVPGVIAWREIE